MSTIDRDILLSRVLDGEASPEDWQAFKALAASDHSVWHELAEAQQDLADLSRAVGAAVAQADSVDLPIEQHFGRRLSARVGRVASWGGWIAAAAVTLAALTGGPLGGPFGTGSLAGGPTGGVSGTGVQAAGLGPFATPDDALRAYVEKGRRAGSVVGEMPERVVLSTEPTADGTGYEVFYIRQIVERVVVPEVYRAGADESGQLVPVRVERPAQPHGSY